MQCTTFLEILEMGEARGLEKALSLFRQRLLTPLWLRFGELDDAVVERVEAASTEQLDRWSAQMMLADTLSGVFSEGRATTSG